MNHDSYYLNVILVISNFFFFFLCGLLRDLLTGVLHHVSWNGENLDGGALGDLLLSAQLLDAMDDLLRVLHANLHCMAEVLLQHILRGCLDHHWRRQRG